MTIYIRASRVHAPGNDFCADGPPRVEQVLKTLNITHDTPVTPALALDYLPLTDVVFALGFADKECKPQADRALREFMGSLLNYCDFVAAMHGNFYDAEWLARKRVQGVLRPELSEHVLGRLTPKLDELLPYEKLHASALLCFLQAHKPDHQVACNVIVQLVKAQEACAPSPGGGPEVLLEHLKGTFLRIVGREKLIDGRPVRDR